MRLLIVSLAVFALGGLASAVWFATRPPPTAVLARFPLELPDGVSVFNGSGTKLAITRDGRAIAIVGVKEGRKGIYLRRMDDPVAVLVRGTEMPDGNLGVNPEFSPDGEWIAFTTSDGLKKVVSAGGTAQTLADSGTAGASWGESGVILFSRSGGLWLGTAEGRDARRVVGYDSSQGVRLFFWPHLLPGNTHALGALRRGNVANVVDSLSLSLVSLTDGVVTDLGMQGTDPYYVASGHVIFGRSGGLVFAAPFSLRRLAFTGPATLVLEESWQGGGGASGFAVSDNGTIVYHRGSANTGRNRTELTIVDRAGSLRAVPGGELNYYAPRISPDGKWVAVRLDPTGNLGGSIAIIDPTTGARQRLTDEIGGAAGEWTRDGRRVVYLRERANSREIVSRAFDRSSADLLLARDSLLGLFDLSVGPSAGLTALRGNSSGNRDIHLAPTDSLSAVRPFVSTPAQERYPTISPDGRWLAYGSDETGRDEIYVQPIPGPGPRVQVSVSGGVEPLWARTGTTLYYRGPARIQMTSLGGTPFQVIRRDSLFADSYAGSRSSRQWDIFPDGRSFLMLRAATGPQISAVDVVLNWTQLLNRAQSASGAPRN